MKVWGGGWLVLFRRPSFIQALKDARISFINGDAERHEDHLFDIVLRDHFGFTKKRACRLHRCLFVPANARLELFKLLVKLDHSRVCYCGANGLPVSLVDCLPFLFRDMRREWPLIRFSDRDGGNVGRRGLGFRFLRYDRNMRNDVRLRDDFRLRRPDGNA